MLLRQQAADEAVINGCRPHLCLISRLLLLFVRPAAAASTVAAATSPMVRCKDVHCRHVIPLDCAQTACERGNLLAGFAHDKRTVARACCMAASAAPNHWGCYPSSAAHSNEAVDSMEAVTFGLS